MAQPEVKKEAWEVLGEAFVTQYYTIMDAGVASRAQLLQLYAPDAMFTFEEHRAMGTEAIKTVLSEKLTFQSIQHIVTKIDCQPTAEQGVIVLVTGRLQTDSDQPHGYGQTFYIKPGPNGSFYLSHDIFRLSLHNS
eukprot:GHVO01061456.1.p1 GENE.GHVO01061456.1~~GHVO01061456.1.p1  ORF type:complete len:136 (+),score=13.21 GHVO01061456.1:121-528(+)